MREQLRFAYVRHMITKCFSLAGGFVVSIPTNPKKMTGLSNTAMAAIIVVLVVVVITVPTVWIVLKR